MTITQNIPALSKDRVNELLEETPNHKRYVSKVITEFNTELKNLKNLELVERTKAIYLFTEWRMKSLDDSGLPEKLRNHLKNLIQTIGKIESRKLNPKWAVVSPNLEILTKWYLNYSKAEKIQIKFAKNGKSALVVTWNDLKRLNYENKSKTN